LPQAAKLHVFFIRLTQNKIIHMNIKQAIPNTLKEYRKAAGLRQLDVANALGLDSTDRICRWEKGGQSRTSSILSNSPLLLAVTQNQPLADKAKIECCKFTLSSFIALMSIVAARDDDSSVLLGRIGAMLKGLNSSGFRYHFNYECPGFAGYRTEASE
jgi:hypothetical protein